MIEDEEEDDVFSGRVKVPMVFKSNERLGVKSSQISPDKQGQQDLIRFYVWNTLTPCMSEECPIYDECPHEVKKQKGGKCKVEQGYINSIASMAYRNFKDTFSEDQFFIVGMHILPMYRHLCRLKIWEWSVREVMYEDDKGRRHLNPIYREIREQIKAISGQWRMLGVGQFQVVEPKNPWGSSGKPPADDRAYYDRLGEIEAPEGEPFDRNNKKILRLRRGK